jgi:hypothetical protein
VNTFRIAAALRLLADAIEEEDGSPPLVVPTPPPSSVKRKRRRSVRVIDVPAVVVDDVTARRAEMALRRAGIYKVRP